MADVDCSCIQMIELVFAKKEILNKCRDDEKACLPKANSPPERWAAYFSKLEAGVGIEPASTALQAAA